MTAGEREGEKENGRWGEREEREEEEEVRRERW